MPPSTPYSPAYPQENKLAPLPSPNQANAHESWTSGPTAATTVRSASPDMSEAGYAHNAMMSPNSFVAGFAPQHHSYSPMTQGAQPWSPGGFGYAQCSQVAQSQNHEMATGQEVAAADRLVGQQGQVQAQGNNGYVTVPVQELP